MKIFVVAALGICAFAASVLAQPQQSLPRVVQGAIQDMLEGCEPERSVLKTGFVVAKDINGDGRKDYIVNYGGLQCGNDPNAYCGTGGCRTQVFASLRDGTYAKVLDDNVRDVRFTRVKGRRPAMVLSVHGSECGRMGASRCIQTLFWNGYEFKPAK